MFPACEGTNILHTECEMAMECFQGFFGCKCVIDVGFDVVLDYMKVGV